jgi:hypothetical protein
MSQVNLRTVKLGNNADTTKNFLITVPAIADGTLTIQRENGALLSNYANDAAAAVGLVPVGGLYRNGSILMIRAA